MSQESTQPPEKPIVGFLRACIDKRFVEVTRAFVEQYANFQPDQYYHEAVAGGALGLPPPVNGADYVYHRAFYGQQDFTLEYMFWQVHYDKCGGIPTDQNLPRATNDQIFSEFFQVFLSQDPNVSFQLRYPLVQKHVFLIAREDDHGNPFVELAPFD